MLTDETLEAAIARQKEIEQESVTLGAQRYRSEEMPWGGGRGSKEEGATVPGQMLMRSNVDNVAEGIVAFLEAAHSGRAGRKHVASKYLLHIEPLQAAYLAVRHCLHAPQAGLLMVTLAHAIGVSVKEHLEMVAMAEEHPGLYRKVTRQLAASSSARHRLGVLRHVREKFALNTLGWSKADMILVGSKLIEIVLDTTPLFEKCQHTRGKHDRPWFLQFTAETVEWLSQAHKKCELLSPLHLPMVAPPRDWQSPFAGGYLTAMLRPRLIRTTKTDYLSDIGGVDLSRVTGAVNAIQKTGWRINRAVLDVMLDEVERGGGHAGLPHTHGQELPPRPACLVAGVPVGRRTAMQKEEVVAWKIRASRVHAANFKNQAERIILAQKLYVAQRFATEERIWFPHFLDFRGRVYPFASYLNPQSDDTGRGLLEFADGMPLGEDGAFWLAVHLAGLWGVDKVSFEDRVAWVMEHEEGILQSALEPHDDNAFWREAEKPWQALAACFDWLGYKLNGDEHVSHTPIAMDGSCSGLQHYSALLRDPIGGAAVNLVPADKPADIYTAVAQRAQVLSDSSADGTNDEMVKAWAGKFCRKVAKQPTMTLCYSATKYGWRNQIEHALRKLDTEGPYLAPDVDRFRASVYAADVIEKALAGTVVAAAAAMAWLKQVSDVCTQAGCPVRWTSPLGLPVLMDYREKQRSLIKVHFGGEPVQFVLQADTAQRSRRKQGSSIAPNFVHSLDAAHLLATVNLCVEEGIHHFAVIHDSFATHACNTSALNVVLREAFVRQYEAPVLEHFLTEVRALLRAVAPEAVDLLPPVPEKGSLDLAAVRNSDFFFA